jgi:hypothetical protein
MKLLTAAIIKQLEKTPLYSTEKQDVVPVLVKFFNPCGAGTWYAVEAEKQEDGEEARSAEEAEAQALLVLGLTHRDVEKMETGEDGGR